MTRSRDLGIPFDGTPGPFNAITDVAGVEVGHTTLISGDGNREVGKGPVRTGVILDYNGHPVPDGTPVQFRITYGEGGIPKQIETSTVKGKTKATVRVEQAGMLIIEAISESARSQPLEFEILSEEGKVVLPTSTQEPTGTPTPTTTVTVTPTLTPSPTPMPPEEENHLGEWFIALVITVGFSLAIYWTSSLMGQVRWGVRGAFLALIGGLLTYCYLATGMPGSQALAERGGTLGLALVILLGSGVGWSASVGWRTLQRKKV